MKGFENREFCAELKNVNITYKKIFLTKLNFSETKKIGTWS
jgi:hypothetical protein